MTHSGSDHADSRARDRLETLIASLLGLAAVLVAVAGYQATLRDGDSIKSFNEGIRSINDANGFYNEATSVVSRDQSLFLEYAKAAKDGDEDLAGYLKEAIMDDNLRAAVDAWEKDTGDDIATPLDTDAYQLDELGEAERLEQRTNAQFTQARKLDDEGDNYALVGVIVATSLFFLGIAGVMSRMRTKVVATALGATTLVGSFALWLTV